MKKGLIFLAILIPTLALLYFSLTRDPRALPSTRVHKTAPDFELRTLEGDTISLRAARGSPVVVNFWSTWCGPCVAEHKLMRQAQQVYSQHGVLFYAILYEDTVDNVRRFIARHGKAALILLDPELRTAINYGVSGVPETFFIDGHGTVLYKHSGMLTPNLLFDQITALVKGGETQ